MNSLTLKNRTSLPVTSLAVLLIGVGCQSQGTHLRHARSTVGNDPSLETNHDELAAEHDGLTSHVKMSEQSAEDAYRHLQGEQLTIDQPQPESISEITIGGNSAARHAETGIPNTVDFDQQSRIDHSNQSTDPTPLVALSTVLASPEQTISIDPKSTADGSTAIDSTAAMSAELEANRLERLIADVRRELYRIGSTKDNPMREYLMIQLLSLVEPSGEFSPPDISERELEMLLDIRESVHVLGEQFDATTDNVQIISDMITQLRDRMDVHPQLALPRLALCTEVRGFGNYEELPRNDKNHYAFLAHKKRQVILYVEIENFHSELESDSHWLTKLSQRWIIYSQHDGNPVYYDQWQTATDRTANKRRDFFTAQIITLPEALNLGRYTLKMQITDEATGAQAEKSIDIDMVADPKMAVSEYR